MPLAFTQADFDELSQPNHKLRHQTTYQESLGMRYYTPSKSKQFRPEFADNTAQLQAVLLHAALKYVYQRKGIPPGIAPDLAAVIALAKQRSAADKELVDGNQRLLQQRIYQHILAKENIGYVSLIGAVAFKCWRLQWPAQLVAQELGISRSFVHKITSNLCHYAEELGFATYPPAPWKGKQLVDWNAIADLWLRAKSVRLIVEMLEIAEPTVYDVLDRLGLRPKRRTNLQAIQEAWLQTKNIAEVGRRTGYPTTTVVRALKHLKLHTPVPRRKRVA
jgi:hypothetical protein